MESKKKFEQIPFCVGLYQICYVTTDLDEGMRALSEMYGISEYRIKRDVSILGMTINQAHVFIGANQIELIQPAGGNDIVYRQILPTGGFTLQFHHFGFMVDTEEQYDRLLVMLKSKNIPLGLELEYPSGRVICADMRSTLGHYMEYIYLSPEVRKVQYADVPHC